MFTYFLFSVNSLKRMHDECLINGDIDGADRIEKKIAILEQGAEYERAMIQNAGSRVAEVNRKKREANLQKDLESGRRKRIVEQAALKNSLDAEDRDKIFTSSSNDDSVHIGSLSIDAIRNRFLQAFGVDPLRSQGIDIRQQYLNKVCADLPPIGSSDREELRAPAISLAQYRVLKAQGRL